MFSRLLMRERDEVPISGKKPMGPDTVRCRMPCEFRVWDEFGNSIGCVYIHSIAACAWCYTCRYVSSVRCAGAATPQGFLISGAQKRVNCAWYYQGHVGTDHPQFSMVQQIRGSATSSLRTQPCFPYANRNQSWSSDSGAPSGVPLRWVRLICNLGPDLEHAHIINGVSPSYFCPSYYYRLASICPTLRALRDQYFKPFEQSNGSWLSELAAIGTERQPCQDLRCNPPGAMHLPSSSAMPDSLVYNVHIRRVRQELALARALPT
jgi:hypothetical protein